MNCMGRVHISFYQFRISEISSTEDMILPATHGRLSGSMPLEVHIQFNDIHLNDLFDPWPSSEGTLLTRLYFSAYCMLYLLPDNIEAPIHNRCCGLIRQCFMGFHKLSSYYEENTCFQSHFSVIGFPQPDKYHGKDTFSKDFSMVETRPN